MPRRRDRNRSDTRKIVAAAPEPGRADIRSGTIGWDVVVSDEATLTYHLRRVRSGGPGYIPVCGASLTGVLEPITHAVHRGLTACPQCESIL